MSGKNKLRVGNLPRVPLAALSREEKRLIAAARAVQKNAYAPISGYKVGVAVRDASGRIHTGVNVENHLLVVPHAEVLALGEMAKKGGRRFTALAEVSPNGGIPCPMCRGYMREFSGEDLTAVVVIGATPDDKRWVTRCTFADIIGEDSFGPGDLGIDPTKF